MPAVMKTMARWPKVWPSSAATSLTNSSFCADVNTGPPMKPMRGALPSSTSTWCKASATDSRSGGSTGREGAWWSLPTAAWEVSPGSALPDWTAFREGRVDAAELDMDECKRLFDGEVVELAPRELLPACVVCSGDVANPELNDGIFAGEVLELSAAGVLPTCALGSTRPMEAAAPCPKESLPVPKLGCGGVATPEFIIDGAFAGEVLEQSPKAVLPTCELGGTCPCGPAEPSPRWLLPASGLGCGGVANPMLDDCTT
mmetsp:Transcript_9981/g.27924  ORF Transcript_9981/g.27924 Transcript_9981/m.27924 type:complete len:258 (+) Transcript_9981:418-1191(+)